MLLLDHHIKVILLVFPPPVWPLSSPWRSTVEGARVNMCIIVAERLQRTSWDEVSQVTFLFHIFSTHKNYEVSLTSGGPDVGFDPRTWDLSHNPS